MIFYIPFQGNKARIVTSILNVIRVNTVESQYRPLFDLCTGGGSVAYYAAHKRLFGNVIANDFDSRIIDLHNLLKAGELEIPKWVEKDEWLAHRNDNTAYGAYLTAVWSFANSRRGTYLYGVDRIEPKRLGQLFVATGDPEYLKKAVALLNDGQIDTSMLWKIELAAKSWRKDNSILDNYLNSYKIVTQDCPQTFKIKQLEHINRNKHLYQVMDAWSNNPGMNLEFHNRSYDEFDFPRDAIVYLDIPYKSTQGYGQEFNHDKFWDWFRAQKVPVFVSEYRAPEDIKSCWSFHLPTGMASGLRRDPDKIENVFWNGIK